MSCEQLVPGFIALNRIKRSGGLCQAIGKLEGFDQVCGSKAFDDELDRRALCELFCCCMDSGRQACVENVLYKADGYNKFKGYFKPEVSYRDGAPIMSGGTRPWYPTPKFPKYPTGSRRPDVVVVKNPDLPPSLDNIQKVYEMKFPGDRYSNVEGPDGKTQWQAYQDLFGNEIDKEAMDAKSCNCEERKKERILERADVYQKARDQSISLVDQVNADTAKAVAAAAGASALGWLGNAARAVGSVLGLGF